MIRFPPEFLDELRERLPVSEVVARRVKLKKQGREWRGLSPFNKEKTPSLFVNDAKLAWFDFSSGKNGDIFAFLIQTEGVTFPEAVERLAAQAGLPLPPVSEADETRERHRKTLHDVMELAAKFFEATLAARAGTTARGYLADRSIDPTSQLRFRLGYASTERFALKEHLGREGIPVEDMVEAGLLVAGDDIPVPYDRFRERVIFPISDLRGRVIAFGGRALEKDAPAKYLNSPETPLFHKGATLYNIASARAAAHKGVPLVVVEGYVDVIAMVGAGYEGTVAPLGTALTEDQLALLWKMADEPLLCFDGDGAGRRAAYRAVDLALPQLLPGKSLRFASLPDGRDPDDLIRARGAAAMAEVIAGALPLVDVLWRREVAAGPLDTPERRAALQAHTAQSAASIADKSVRELYRAELRERCWKLFNPRKPQRVTAAPRAMLASLPPPSETVIAAALLRWPALIEQDCERLAALEFTDRRVAKFVQAAIETGSPNSTVIFARAAALLPHDDEMPQWWTQALALQRAQTNLRDAKRQVEDDPSEISITHLREAQDCFAAAAMAGDGAGL